MPGSVPRLLLALGVAALTVEPARCQDLEPRRWTHLPVDLNVVGVGYGLSDVELFLDPVLQIEDARADMQTFIGSYVRTFEVAGRSARVDVLVPYSIGEWTGRLEGEPASTERSGLGDPRIRLSVNLTGAPPLKGEEYVAYRRANPVTTTFGAALAVTLPLGQYDPNRLINLGQNRFSIRPQLGVLHTRGPWSVELSGSIFFFTQNTEFFGDSVLQRDPVYGLQAHVVRSFGRGWWIAGGAGWGLGGETEVDGVNADNHIGDFLAGVSVGAPVARNQSVKIGYLRTETRELVGADADSLVLAWSVRF